MKTIINIPILLFLLAIPPMQAQDSTIVYNFDFHKLKPIVQLFGTASYDIENSNYGFAFGRAHLGFQYQFNEKWSSKIILDRGRPTTVGLIVISDSLGSQLNVQNISSEGSYYTMWLKFTSLQWKVNDNLTIEGGAILQNHYITQERFWELRYVTPTIQDLYWKTPSSDLGFIATYKLNKVITIDAAITNGEGPRCKQDAFGKVKIAGGIDINPSEKIQTRIFYHNRQSGINNTATEQMISFFMGIKQSEKIRIGGEFNYLKNLENIDGIDSYGFSVFSSCRLTDKTKVFARYDKVLYQISSGKNLSGLHDDGNMIIGGVAFSPSKGVDLSLNYHCWLPDDSEKLTNNHISLSLGYKYYKEYYG